MYKVLAVDLDGTLTDNQKKVPPRNTHTLIRAQQQKGMRIVLASGRPVQGIIPLARQLHLQHFGGFIMAFNGGCIIDCKTGEYIYRKELAPAHYPSIFEKACRAGLHLIAYHQGHVCCEQPDSQYARYAAFTNNMPIRHVRSFPAFLGFPVPKILVAGSPSLIEPLEAEMHHHLMGRMSVCRSEPFFLEILPEGVNKAVALDHLLQRIGVKAEEAIACGDGFNDVCMIEYAGLGVAMGNAQEAVKRAASLTTASNEECGVAQVVEQFVLAASPAQSSI